MKGFQYIQNISENGTATILLYGTIGGDINGTDFANEIEHLQNKASQINVRINSPGGSVLEGHSILNAIQNSLVPVDVYIDGVAASIAGVLAMAGRKVFMKDHAVVMLHNPFGEASDEALAAIKNSLVKIYENKSGLNPESISKMFEKETWLDAKEALALGLVDEIISTNKKIKVDRTSLQNMFQVYNQPITNPKDEEMINVKNQLGIDENANEEAVVNSISDLQTQIENLNKELSAEKEKKEQLEKTLAEIEAEKVAKKEAEVTEMVNSFVSAGKIKAEEADKFKTLAKVDYETIKNTLSQIGSTNTNKEAVKIFNAAAVTPVKPERADWTIRDWEKKDPTGLNKIKNETPEVYEKMYEDFYKTNSSK